MPWKKEMIHRVILKLIKTTLNRANHIRTMELGLKNAVFKD